MILNEVLGLPLAEKGPLKQGPGQFDKIARCTSLVCTLLVIESLDNRFRFQSLKCFPDLLI